MDTRSADGGEPRTGCRYRLVSTLGLILWPTILAGVGSMAIIWSGVIGHESSRVGLPDRTIGGVGAAGRDGLVPPGQLRQPPPQLGSGLDAHAGASGGRPVADLSGTVYLPNGRPAAGVVLRALFVMSQLFPGHDRTPPGGVLFSELAVPIRTNAQGRYRTRLDPRDPSARRPQPWPAGARASWFLMLISGAGYGGAGAEVKPGVREVHDDIHLQPGDRVSGTVVAAITGRPIAGATVHVLVDIGWPMEFSQVKTDKRGRFRVPDQLPPGLWRIGADAKEWATLAEPLPKMDPRRPPKAQARHLTFRMVPRSVAFEVLVLQADGTPLRDEPVEMWTTSPTIGPGVGGGLTGPTPRVTDGNGRFRDGFTRVPDPDLHRPWAMGYPALTLWVEFRGRKSNSGTMDTLHPGTKKVVVRLK